jgi:hypothetical protein
MSKRLGGGIFALMSFVALVSFAAGADNGAVLGKVVQFSANQGSYTFQFAQSAGGKELMPGCRQLQIEVRYEPVSQYWRAFRNANYPTKAQTKAAINFLKKSLRERREIYFSSFSNGLAPTATRCVFTSRALALEYWGEKELVVSYYTLPATKAAQGM